MPEAAEQPQPHYRYPSMGTTKLVQNRKSSNKTIHNH